MRGKLKFAAAFAFAALIFAYPEASLIAARDAMENWINSVVPALLPFIALLPALTNDFARKILQKIFGCVFERIFNLPPELASAVVIGMAAGSPAGAIAVSSTKGVSKSQTARAAGMACGMGPIFLVSVLGTRFAIAQFFAQIFTGIIFRNVGNDNDEIAPTYAAEGNMLTAMLAVLKVCGYMMLFASLGAVSRSALGNCVNFVMPIFDAVGSISVLRDINAPSWVVAAVFGFGGACILTQNISVLNAIDVNILLFATTRVYCGVLSGGLYAMIEMIMFGNINVMTICMITMFVICMSLSFINNKKFCAIFI